MQSNKHIDIYCERIDASFWAEPLNAISNIAFLIAAFAAYLAWKKSAQKPENLVLIIIAACVGVGSFIFHTFATTLSMLADIIPIIIFIHYGFALVLRRIIGLSWKYSIVLIIIFLGINFAIKLSPFAGLLNLSMQYIPTLLVLFAVAAILYKRKNANAKLFAISGVVFAISLFFRSIDMQVCEILPLGTHFMWHTLNPVVMYLVMRSLIKNK